MWVLGKGYAAVCTDRVCRGALALVAIDVRSLGMKVEVQNPVTKCCNSDIWQALVCPGRFAMVLR